MKITLAGGRMFYFLDGEWLYLGDEPVAEPGNELVSALMLVAWRALLRGRSLAASPNTGAKAAANRHYFQAKMAFEPAAKNWMKAHSLLPQYAPYTLHWSGLSIVDNRGLIVMQWKFCLDCEAPVLFTTDSRYCIECKKVRDQQSPDPQEDL